MANTVKIFLRIRTSDGKRRYVNPITAGNGKLKPGWALVNGKPEHHPEGVYHIRYTASTGRRVFEKAGADPTEAMVAKLRREHQFEARKLGLAVSPKWSRFKLVFTERLLPIGTRPMPTNTKGNHNDHRYW